MSMPLPADAQFAVEAPRELDEQGRGICGAVEVIRRGSGRRRRRGRRPGSVSRRGRAGHGPGLPAFPGCPTLARTVTASYADAEVTGLVTTPERPDACAGAVTLEAVSWAPDGTEGTPVRFSSGLDGTYTLGAAAAPGTRYQITAVRELDPSGLGVCGEDTSPEVEVPRDGDGVDGDLDQCPDVDGPKDVAYYPGCPRLARTVTAAYAAAAITGQVSVLGPNAAPAGTCLPTEVRAFTHARRGGGAGRSDHRPRRRRARTPSRWGSPWQPARRTTCAPSATSTTTTRSVPRRPRHSSRSAR